MAARRKHKKEQLSEWLQKARAAPFAIRCLDSAAARLTIRAIYRQRAAMGLTPFVSISHTGNRIFLSPKKTKEY